MQSRNNVVYYIPTKSGVEHHQSWRCLLLLVNRPFLKMRAVFLKLYSGLVLQTNNFAAVVSSLSMRAGWFRRCFNSRLLMMNGESKALTRVVWHINWKRFTSGHPADKKDNLPSR